MALHGAALAAWKKKHPALVRQWRKPGGKKSKPSTKRRTSTKKRATSSTHKELHMAKSKKSGGKKKGSRKGKRRGGHRHSGGLFGGLTKRDLAIAGGVAAGYAFLQAKNNEKQISWFNNAPVVVTIGRAGTYAAAAGAAYALGLERKYTKPLAIGLGAVALIKLAARKFKFYDSDKDAKLAGELGQGGVGGGQLIEGDVDLAPEYRAA
jgi:hypothetical protein